MVFSFARSERKLQRLNRWANEGNARAGTRAEADPSMADRESVITDLIDGQFTRSVRVVAFNGGRKWSEDVSRGIAEEIQKRVDYVDLTDPIRSFVDRYAGSGQLSLRLR